MIYNCNLSKNVEKKGYSLLEVMIAIVIFSTGMISFLMYQAKANSTLFESESTQMAYSIGTALAEDINALTPGRFYVVVEGLLDSGHSLNQFIPDSDGDFRNRMRTITYHSPFNTRGEPVNDGQYLFYRSVMFNHYSDKTDQTGAFTEEDPQAYLRHVDVVVGWPKRGHGSVRCNDFNTFDNRCNYMNIPVVRFMRP